MSEDFWGGGIWFVPTSGANARSTTAHISSSCRTLSFFCLLAAEEESRPAPRAIMQQHVKPCSFALCRLQHLFVSYWQGLHKAESQYLWPLKHKTTRTIIHQSNPLQMNNKAEFITWSLQTSTVRNTQLTKLLFEGLVEERSSVVCKVARVLLSTFLESTTNNSMLKKKKKKRLLVIRIGPS